MKREDFDNLDILEQIHYINNQLADGNTLRDITSNISIARSTIRNRFKKIGYSYTKELNIEEKKEANKKVPAKKVANKKVPAKEVPSKEAPAKKNKDANILDSIKVGDIVKFRVEGEEIEHPIEIVRIGKKYILCVMAMNENEVFNIRRTDFKKQVFNWKDRHGEEYNIIVTL